MASSSIGSTGESVATSPGARWLTKALRGDAKAVELALSKGIVDWQGLVHNIDYLDLDDNIKRIVGQWWRKWVKTEAQNNRSGNGDSDEEEEDSLDGEEDDPHLAHIKPWRDSSDEEDDDDDDDDDDDMGGRNGVGTMQGGGPIDDGVVQGFENL